MSGFFFVETQADLNSILTYLDISSNDIDTFVRGYNNAPSVASSKYFWVARNEIPIANDPSAAVWLDISGSLGLFTTYTSWEFKNLRIIGTDINTPLPAGSRIRSNGYAQPGADADTSDLGVALQNFFESYGNQAKAAFLIPAASVQPPCFLAGAMVETDQGPLPIETINPAVNTIDGRRIVAITETNPSSAKMVRLLKGVIGPNVPDKDTDITHSHNVLYKGEFRYASMVPGLKYRPYKGETLYNVLMETHETMVVNNMITKTLPPEHPAAQQYRK